MARTVGLTFPKQGNGDKAGKPEKAKQGNGDKAGKPEKAKQGNGDKQPQK